MKSATTVGLKDVQAVYSGPEGQLWELVMGQQIHVGGFRSSMDLAEKAGIGPGMAGRRSVLLHRRRNAIPHAIPKRGADARRGRHRNRRRAWPPPLRSRRTCRPHRVHAGRRLRHQAARRERRFRLGRRRLVLRGRQAAADRRSRPAGETGRHHRLHRLGRRPDALGRRRGGPLPHVHEVPQHADASTATPRCWRPKDARCSRRKTPADSRRTSTSTSTC